MIPVPPIDFNLASSHLLSNTDAQPAVIRLVLLDVGPDGCRGRGTPLSRALARGRRFVIALVGSVARPIFASGLVNDARVRRTQAAQA